jgi:hypothetical protein
MDVNWTKEINILKIFYTVRSDEMGLKVVLLQRSWLGQC